MRDSDFLARAATCPFCASADLSLWQGAVTCDECMAAGPFEAHFDGKSYDEEQRLKLLAVTRWNARARDSGRLPKGEDSRSEAECEASQSGDGEAGASPKTPPQSPPKGSPQ